MDEAKGEEEMEITAAVVEPEEVEDTGNAKSEAAFFEERDQVPCPPPAPHHHSNYRTDTSP